MAALGASDVVYTPQGRSYGSSIEDNSARHKKLKVQFGDAAKTYPAGGIPLSGLANWGFPYSISEVMIVDAGNADGYVYKWDAVNNKLRIYNATTAHSHDVLLKNAVQADGATTRVNAATNKLGANTGSDITVAGGGANGGVQAIAAAAGSEVSTSFAPAATTLYFYVRGH